MVGSLETWPDGVLTVSVFKVVSALIEIDGKYYLVIPPHL